MACSASPASGSFPVTGKSHAGRRPSARHSEDPAISTLAQQRCFHHAHREAVCRCPNCANYYCRECVIEHEDTLICAACLRRLASPAPRHRTLGRAAGVLAAFAALLLSWLFFYYVGRVLILLPSDVHEGTEWQP